MSTGKNKYLDAVLKTHNITLDETKVEAYRKERDRIKEALQDYYKGKMYCPLNSGSYAKHTAINTNYDMDLAVPFTKGQFKTLREMFEDVESFIHDLKKDDEFPITKVTRQRRSINLMLQVKGLDLDMDVVPGRELSDGQYEDDHNLNLYDCKVPTWIQTNIKAHNELLESRPKEREVVKLLKAWKTAKGEDMKSFLVELMILEAFDKDSTLADKKLYERLTGSLAFMRDNITTIDFVDPACASNIVSDTLNQTEKELLKGKFGRMLDDIDESYDKLTQYFPINANHKDQVDEDVLPKFKNYPKSPGANSFA